MTNFDEWYAEFKRLAETVLLCGLEEGANYGDRYRMAKTLEAIQALYAHAREVGE